MDSFIVYMSFNEAIRELPAESQVRLYNAIFDYQKGMDVSLSGIEKAIWSLIKPQLDANNKRRADGQKGGRPKAPEKIPVASESENHTFEDAKPVVTEIKTSGFESENHRLLDEKPNDNDNVNDKENAPTEHKRKSAPRFIPPTAEQVRDYCKERNNNVNAEQFVDFYTSKGWKVGKETMKDWRAAVRTWEKRESWNASQVKKKNTFTSFQQNNYDFAELEQALEGSQGG